ncbi:class E sortase [Streptomyces sp. NPDC014864]|uniref:class E sortase n=1 Tax=Streptomyces sp. NPDC014864 TaxID=3364924 RepID=UPI0036F90ACA
MTALRPERETDTSYGQQPYGEPGAFEEWYGSAAQEWYGSPAAQDRQQQPYGEPQPYDPQQQTYAQPQQPYGAPPYEAPRPYAAPPPQGPPPVAPLSDQETMALLVPEPSPADAHRAGRGAASRASSVTPVAGTTPGGRAARRKAAKGRHGRHGGSAGAAGTAAEGDSAAGGPSAPLSRVEARRRARAQKPGPGVLASRIVGEAFITTGVVMLLFVTYQLWWTNIRAHAQAGSEAHHLQDDWASGRRNPGTFEPGQGFAILHIPRLDVVVPIAEGTSKEKVLDKGMVGHYGEGDLNTAMPDARTGNFGLAGHRNTHGEPFRYINRLTPGDAIVVETQDTYFVYKMASMLPVTPPSNTGVLDPVPRGSGFTGPGRYITLTTCTPEFTSKYRLIVWGKMVEERPRSKGKPDALVS